MRTDQSIINRYTVTAGVLSYPVTFPLFEQGDVLVMLSTDGGATERELSLGDDYSVSINGSQTGGTVTLKSGVAQAGNIIAFLSNVPYTQELDLSNVATIDVNATERQLDRTTQQVQQVRELATRHITVPATSSTTPDELLAEIFTAQHESIESAASAASSAAAAGASEQGAASYLAQTQQAKTEAVAAIQAQQSVSESAVEQAGDAQAVRLEELASNILVAGTAYNKEATVTLDQPVAAGTVVSLPSADGQQMMYRVGASTLRMGFNGTLLFCDEQFEEVGNAGSLSTSVKLLFDAEAGDVLNFFVYSQNVTIVTDEESGLFIDDQKRLSAAGIKAVADEAKEIAQTIQRMPMGTAFPYTGKDVPAGTLRADGTTYTDMRSAFPEFYEWVVNSGLTVPLASYALVEGSCGYYGLDTSTGTVRMPTLAAGVFGTVEAGKYGLAVQAGLPNITGELINFATTYSTTGDISGGALQWKGTADKTDINAGSTRAIKTLKLDASRSSSIYGRADTVIPSHVKYPWVIVVYNAAVPPSVAQAGEFIEMLDGKAGVNAENFTAEGKSLLARLGMPSTKRNTLTLGASGTSYTAPEAGWFYFSGGASSGTKYMTANSATNNMNITGMTVSGVSNANIVMPAKKGDVVRCNYSTDINMRGYFYYAEGGKN